MSFKIVELIAVLGALWLLWRRASRLGAEAAAEKKARAAAEETARGGV